MKRSLLPVLLATIIACMPSQWAQAQSFTGAGSTFFHPILAKWAKAHVEQEGDGGAVVSADDTIDYEPVGSLAGVMRILKGDVDFGVTDVPLTPEEVVKHNLAQFPIVSGGIAIAVNVKGVSSGALRLTGPVLAGIYLGEITRWSDPALVALNPDVKLPDAPIVAVRRSDGSGTTFNFSAFLAEASGDWRTQVGVGAVLAWPVGIPAKGNREVAERVQETPNAIGYVEASQAARTGLPIAAIANKAGNFVAPTPANLQATTGLMTWDPARHFYSDVASATGANAYPITATVYVLMSRPLGATARARRALSFFRLSLTQRTDDAVGLGYVPLPAPVVSQVLDYWRAAGARIAN